MTGTALPAKIRTLRTVLLVLGSIVIVIVLSLTVMRVAFAVTQEDSSGTFEVSEDFDAIELNTSASDVTIEYRDVDDATLVFEQGDGNASFERSVSDGVLRVDVEHRGWWGFDFGGHGSSLEVTLPESLRSAPVEIDLQSTAGDVTIAGRYGPMTIESTAGDVQLSGGAAELSLTTTAGDVDVEDFALRGSLVGQSTAGDVSYELLSVPERVDIESTAGNVTFTVPDGDYRIDASSTAGEVDSRVSSDTAADRVFEFRSTAGDIRISNP